MITWAVAVGVPSVFSLVGWLVLRDIDYWLSEPENPMLDQLHEIRDLPEVGRPYDWDRESAA